MSAVVVADGDQALADALRDELLAMCWAARADFVYNPEPLSESIARARALAAERDAGAAAGAPGKKPVVLLDHCDNTASGGTMDSTMVLRACLDAGLSGAVFYAIFDPASVDAMFAAGEGAEVALELGGKMRVPVMPTEETPPLAVTGSVVKLREAQTGPGSYGEWGQDGRMGVLRLPSGGDGGSILVCVISKHVEPNNTAVLEKLEIDPYAHSFLVLKSRVHWQNSRGFGPVYHAVVECGTVAAASLPAAATTRAPRPSPSAPAPWTDARPSLRSSSPALDRRCGGSWWWGIRRRGRVHVRLLQVPLQEPPAAHLPARRGRGPRVTRCSR